MKVTRRDVVMVIILVLACGALHFVDLRPPVSRYAGTKEKARVISVDNHALMLQGLVRQGSQLLEVEILSGKHKWERFKACNQVRAQMDLDKIFEPGDTILVAVPDNASQETSTLNAQDYYRTNYTFLLFGLFALLLIAFGGLTGFNALLSFVFSCLVIWKLAVPLSLAGHSALLISFLAVALLSAVIILLVAGLSWKGFAALCGAMLGVLTSCVLAWYFTHLFKINGATMPYSQALLYSGYEYLNLPEIFIGAIFLSSSGAVMDLAMDVASGLEEISMKRPGIPVTELLGSGLRIGRSVVGTMTTTLLLAYSGGYITLMMAFVAQGVSALDFINNPLVASEIVKTLVGSFGLVTVAPFTALIGAFIFGGRKKAKSGK